MLHALSFLALALAPAQPPQSIPDDTPVGVQLATVADDTGLTALTERLKGVVPTGAGVLVAQAEALSGGGYKPNPSNPEFAGKSFTLVSGATSASGHATTVGRYFYGLVTGVAPGPDDIDCYSAGGFLGGNFLNGTALTPPQTVAWKVENNSWIGAGPKAYLRKMDWAISQQGLVVCSGTNNGSGPLDVPLFSHLFNGIAVGRSDGNHKAGGTLPGYDKAGRQKPEMVAPAGATSYATPLVSGGAALLVETARTHPALSGNPAAELPEVVKAILMAGAEHRPGWANDAPQSGPSRGLATLPLDPLFGADELDVNHAHWILTGGEHDGATTAAAATDTRHNGWDHFTIAAGESRFWRFQVAAEKPFASVLVTWNRTVSADFSSFEVPYIDLELFVVDGSGGLVSLVGDPGLPYFDGGNVRSESAKDNLDHLYVTGLKPGEYVLEVERTADGKMPFTAALAWELECAPPFAYGTAKTTSSGQTPSMGWRGIPSAAENDFDVTVSNAEPNKSGIFFYGSGQKSAPFYGGLKLVQPPVVRTPVITTDASGAAVLPVSIDPIMVGEQRNYQFWFRDPAHPDGTNVGLSDAVEVVFCP
jgi:hypothetical protein